MFTSAMRRPGHSFSPKKNAADRDSKVSRKSGLTVLFTAFWVFCSFLSFSVSISGGEESSTLSEKAPEMSMSAQAISGRSTYVIQDNAVIGSCDFVEFDIAGNPDENLIVQIIVSDQIHETSSGSDRIRSILNKKWTTKISDHGVSSLRLSGLPDGEYVVLVSYATLPDVAVRFHYTKKNSLKNLTVDEPTANERTITGSGEPGMKVTVQVDGQDSYTCYADSQGKFVLNLSSKLNYGEPVNVVISDNAIPANISVFNFLTAEDRLRQYFTDKKIDFRVMGDHVTVNAGFWIVGVEGTSMRAQLIAAQDNTTVRELNVEPMEENTLKKRSEKQSDARHDIGFVLNVKDLRLDDLPRGEYRIRSQILLNGNQIDEVYSDFETVGVEASDKNGTDALVATDYSGLYYAFGLDSYAGKKFKPQNVPITGEFYGNSDFCSLVGIRYHVDDQKEKDEKNPVRWKEEQGSRLAAEMESQTDIAPELKKAGFGIVIGKALDEGKHTVTVQGILKNTETKEISYTEPLTFEFTVDKQEGEQVSKNSLQKFSDEYGTLR